MRYVLIGVTTLRLSAIRITDAAAPPSKTCQKSVHSQEDNDAISCLQTLVYVDTLNQTSDDLRGIEWNHNSHTSRGSSHTDASTSDGTNLSVKPSNGVFNSADPAGPVFKMEIFVVAMILAGVILGVGVREVLLFCEIPWRQQLGPQNLWHMKMVFGLSSFINQLAYSSVIPVSLNLARAIGWSAAESGFLCSAISFGQLLGQLLAFRVWQNVSHQKQRYALVFVPFIESGIMLLLVWLLLKPDLQSAGGTLGFVIIGIRACSGFLSGVDADQFDMILEVCPDQEKAIVSAIGNNGALTGLVLGFSLTSVLLFAYNEKLDPFEAFAAPLLVIAALSACMSVAYSWAVPVELHQLKDHKDESKDVPASSEDLITRKSSNVLTLSAVHIDDESRKTVAFQVLVHVWLAYATINALELATSFLLQKDYHWQVEDLSAGIGIVFLLSVIISISVTVLRYHVGTEWDWYLGPIFCLIGVGGSVLYFTLNFDIHGIEILIGDCMVYPGVAVCLTMMLGYGMWISDKGHWYTPDNLIFVSNLAQSTCAFLMGPGVRWLLANYGRMGYATMQASLVGSMALNYGFCAFWALWDSPGHNIQDQAINLGVK